MSAGSSSDITRKRPANDEVSGIAKRRGLLFKDDNGLLETAVTQSGIDMEQLTLNTVNVNKDTKESERTIPLESWFVMYPGLDVTSEAMWSAHSTMLVLMSCHDLRKFIVADHWNAPDVYPAHNACRYTLKTFQNDSENGSFPADVNRDGGKYNSDITKRRSDRTLQNWTCGERGWIGVPATALTMILPMRRLVRGVKNHAKTFPIPLSRSLEGALECSPFLCVVPDMPAIQVAVGCKFFRSYGHEGGGATVRGHWCQITDVVVHSW